MPIKVFSEQSLLQLPQRYRANFVNSLTGFKSANLIGTKGQSGVHNLAMVSSCFHVGANPPLIGMIMRPHTVVRDTLQNIKETGVYTINHVHKGIVEKAHQCAARYEPQQSEFAEVGLSVQMSNVIDAPFVAESHIKLGMQVEQITLIEINKTEMVIGKIVEVEIKTPLLLADGYVDIEKAESLAVSCLDSYHTTTRIDRYSYAKPNEALHSIWQQNNDPES